MALAGLKAAQPARTVLDAGEREHLLGRGGRDEARAARRGDQAHTHGAAVAHRLVRDSVRRAGRIAPVAAADGHDAELRERHRALDRVGDLGGALDAEADVAVRVTDGDEGLEARALAGGRLLLDGHDLHALVLEVLEEVVDDLRLLDRERVEEDLLDRRDLASLDEAAQLGYGHPLLVVVAAAPAAATATVATPAVTAPAAVATPATVWRGEGEYVGTESATRQGLAGTRLFIRNSVRKIVERSAGLRPQHESFHPLKQLARVYNGGKQTHHRDRSPHARHARVQHLPSWPRIVNRQEKLNGVRKPSGVGVPVISKGGWIQSDSHRQGNVCDYNDDAAIALPSQSTHRQILRAAKTCAAGPATARSRLSDAWRLSCAS